MRVRLRVRLLLPLVVLLLGDALATGWAAVTAASHAEARIAAQLDTVTRTVVEPPTFPLTPPVLVQMKRLSAAEFVLLKRGGDLESTFTRLPEVDGGEVLRHDGEEYRVRRVTLSDGHPNAGGTLLVCYPESLRRTAVTDAVLPTLFLGVAVGLAAMLLVGIGSRVVGRVRQLQQQTRTIADGDFRPLPLPAQDDELRDLVTAVNDMTRKLAAYRVESHQTERLRVLGQFSGGLAHQLRNAAAGAKLAVQLYMKHPDGGDREPLEVALRQLGRIEMNLSQFLTLGKPAPVALTPLDVDEVLAAAVRLFGPQSRHAGIALTWQPGDTPLTLAGDATLLGHLFANLIGNAMDAAGPGGEVAVQRTSRVIEVSDSGPGPGVDVADRLFEPFVTGKEQGIGLGLAVAKQAADAHGATLDWLRRDGRTVFRVAFPG